MLRVVPFCLALALALAADDQVIGMGEEVVVSALSGGRDTTKEFKDMNLGKNKLFPGNRVWEDLPESAWKWVPDWLLGITMLLPDGVIRGKKEMFWKCLKKLVTGKDLPRHCEIFVFVYACAECDDKQGEIVGGLGDAGFELISCGPVVVPRAGGHGHRLKIFAKDIDEDEEFRFIFNKHTEFTKHVTFGVNEEPSRACHKNDDPMTCESTGGKCEWDSSLQPARCVKRKCRGIPFGPGSSIPCSELCIDDDLAGPR